MSGNQLGTAVGAFQRWFANPRAREWSGLVLFALAAFQLVLDFKILPPTAIDWIFSFATDTSQYYLAFAYYRNADWHFPLTHMETMLHPVGASFTLADGIPLLAIPLKAVRFALPADFQFYGAWLFSCILGSAVFAKILLERLLTLRPLVWAGIVILTLAPPMVARFAHCHLSAHWLVLAAFWTVMEERRLPMRRIWLFSTMSLFVQPYLFVIVSGLLITAFWVHRRERRQLLIGAVGWLIAVALSAWALGYFDMAVTTAQQADRYHADVTALFSAMGTSSIVPEIPMRGDIARMRNGSAEGFAYLGLGGLALFVALLACLVAPWVSRGERRRLHSTWVVLGLMSLLMAAFATSTSPFILGERSSGIPALTDLLEPITARLRSAGRFIWPLYYYVLVFGLQAAEQWLTRVKVASAGLVSGLVLVAAQAADLGPWLLERGQKRALTDPPPVGDVPDSVKQKYSAKTRIMALHPPKERHRCPGASKKTEAWRGVKYYPLALFGARRGLIVNTDFRATARLTREQHEAVCDYGEAMANAAKLPPDVMVVTPEDLKPASKRTRRRN